MPLNVTFNLDDLWSSKIVIWSPAGPLSSMSYFVIIRPTVTMRPIIIIVDRGRIVPVPAPAVIYIFFLVENSAGTRKLGYSCVGYHYIQCKAFCADIGQERD